MGHQCSTLRLWANTCSQDCRYLSAQLKHDYSTDGTTTEAPLLSETAQFTHLSNTHQTPTPSLTLPGQAQILQMQLPSIPLLVRTMHSCHLALSRIATAKKSPTYGKQPLAYLACKSARRKTKARKANYLPLRLPFLGSSSGGACFLLKLKKRATYTPALAYQTGKVNTPFHFPFSGLLFPKE